MIVDIIKINNFEVTQEVIDTLKLPSNYEDIFEFLEEYTLSHISTKDREDSTLTYHISLSSLYGQPRFDLRDDSVVMYFINSSEELEYTIYTEEDGGTIPITTSVHNLVYEIDA